MGKHHTNPSPDRIHFFPQQTVAVDDSDDLALAAGFDVVEQHSQGQILFLRLIKPQRQPVENG